MELLLIIIISLSFLNAVAKVTAKTSKKISKKSKSKKVKAVPIIDTTKEMNQVYNYLTKHYKEFYNYKELNQIEEEDKLLLLQYIWQRWEKRFTKKSLKEAFPKYDKNLLYEISLIETGRIYTYYKQQEFKNIEKLFNEKFLVEITGNVFISKCFYCLTDNMVEVFLYTLEDREPKDIAPFFYLQNSILKEKFPEYNIQIWMNNKFISIDEKGLKQFCKENNIKYSFCK